MNILELLQTEEGLEILEREFPLVSQREKSVPDAGSPCFKTNQIKPGVIRKVNQQINHKNGHVTLITPDNGYIKFWRK